MQNDILTAEIKAAFKNYEDEEEEGEEEDEDNYEDDDDDQVESVTQRHKAEKK